MELSGQCEAPGNPAGTS